MSFLPPPDEWEDEEPRDPPDLEVEITDPTRIAVLYDTRGEPLIELMDRDSVPFGFQRTAEDE